jgi:methylthioribose-1-phosphate isomerase
MSVSTISWEEGRVKIIDQTQLPHRLVWLYCGNLSSLWRAIKELKVRGAPVLGVAAALGLILGIKNSKAKDFKQFSKDLDRTIQYLSSARPTAVNLFWGLSRMRKVAYEHRNESIGRIKNILLKETFKIMEEDKRVCRQMAIYGASLIKNKDRILTHCNAGSLATVDYGTALGVIYKAKEQGKKISVYADETRPLLQGARLTTWELLRNKIEVTLICDNMAADLMQKRQVDKILVGADRIASNGDTANKVGTYALAVLAQAHKIPFYVVAPLSTFDLNLKSGKDVPIEQRKKEEVTHILGKRIAPPKVKVYNPAFDITPNNLITAIITEVGIFRKPYEKTLSKLAKRARE